MDSSLIISFENSVPKDKEFEHKRDTDLVNAGVMTRNEARQRIGLDPLTNADQLLVPLNLVPLNFTRQLQENRAKDKEFEGGNASQYE